jgi:hypothetical protein
MQVRYLNAATQILQEVGTARHVLITCGSEEIDGYAFCAGLASFHGLYDTRSNSRPPIASVIHLIMGAIFRPKGSHQLSHGICTLGALLDMYHSREASVQHDKVYALLGMSVDGTSETSLSPNYNLPWEELFGNLVRFLLHKEIRVDTSPTRGHILIKGAVSVLGSIYGIRSDAGFEQTVEIMWRDVWSTDYHDWTAGCVWSFRLSATPIMEGDIICLFLGASLPTMVRICEDHCFIVQIAPIPPTKVNFGEEEVDWAKFEKMARHLPTRNLQCVWDWATLREPLQKQEESVECMIEAPMVSGIWNSMLIYFKVDMGDYKWRWYFRWFGQSQYPQMRCENIPGTTKDPSCMELAKRWLHKCVGHHDCQAERRLTTSNINLTRVLYVERTDCGVLKARLHYPSIAEAVDYLTLSHVWGTRKFVVLTKENHDAFLEDIVITDLSKTFRDALHVTVELGFSFLWIDSLCIIQDDPDDWMAESKRMAHIYKNAICNICAAVSTATTSGFLPEQRALPPRPPVVRLGKTRYNQGQLASEWEPWGKLREVQLYQRAWVLQEQILVSPAKTHQ